MKFLKKIKSKFINSSEQNGFSLVEMLISMVVFLIVTASIYGLLNVGQISRNRSSRRTDVLKNARAAMHLIGRDALNAGLSYHKKGAIVPDDFLEDILEVPADTDDERDILTAVIAGDNLHENNLQDDPNKKTDIIAFAFRDLNFNAGNTIDLLDVKAGADSSTVRLELNTSVTDNIKPFDLVLIETDNTQVGAVVSSIVDSKNIDLAVGDPLDLNLPRDGSEIDGTLLKKCNPPTLVEHCVDQVTSLKRFYWVSYRVKRDGTLVRTIYGNNTGKPADEQIQEQPLAYNVKDLQFKYVLANGAVTDNPVAGDDGEVGTEDDRPNDFNLIRQVSVKIVVQSTELDEQTKKPETIELNSIFSLRNLQYDIG